MPARGNEKPDAESTVKAVQRRFATPVPRVADLDELNALLRQLLRGRARPGRAVARRPVRDQGPPRRGPRRGGAAARARFDPCVIQPAVAVDKYQTVAFDGNRYSVPRPFAFQMVTVKGYVDRVVIVAGGQVVATHARSLRASTTMVLDPLHYLATLDRKPGALDHAPVFRDWELPACFADFRAELEQQHGPPGRGAAVRPGPATARRAPAGARRARRSRPACGEQLDTAEAVIRRTRALAAIEAASAPSRRPIAESSRHDSRSTCRCPT